jgi:hypothetical protein
MTTLLRKFKGVGSLLNFERGLSLLKVQETDYLKLSAGRTVNR